MIEEQLIIINKLGLHARAAAKFVTTAAAFGSTIRVGKAGKMVDGKSIMSVMMLAANQGTTLDVLIDGKDEEQAFIALKALVDNYFEEGE
ncbi:HPr family phosphocarrier protein [Zooshikella harenae]|uniref:HPr family phosphocarrier protein n=1 Tax=Zooshikella harenae TaxID=2827238 RepID=A0ABS5Z7V4_9GAMM|nr:HPr family phosphocarrier protein [Zooshikella harenae]MBU2710080.1 HPr family phosphocarrier protein [Zooshikella harenae]